MRRREMETSGESGIVADFGGGGAQRHHPHLRHQRLRPGHAVGRRAGVHRHLDSAVVPESSSFSFL